MIINVNNIRQEATLLLKDASLSTRQARSAKDTLLLAFLVEKEPDRKNVQAMLFKAALFATNNLPR
jgi:hypothetical protein